MSFLSRHTNTLSFYFFLIKGKEYCNKSQKRYFVNPYTKLFT